jgi:hypothetical protein
VRKPWFCWLVALCAVLASAWLVAMNMLPVAIDG